MTLSLSIQTETHRHTHFPKGHWKHAYFITVELVATADIATFPEILGQYGDEQLMYRKTVHFPLHWEKLQVRQNSHVKFWLNLIRSSISKTISWMYLFPGVFALPAKFTRKLHSFHKTMEEGGGIRPPCWQAASLSPKGIKRRSTIHRNLAENERELKNHRMVLPWGPASYMVLGSWLLTGARVFTSQTSKRPKAAGLWTWSFAEREMFVLKCACEWVTPQKEVPEAMFVSKTHADTAGGGWSGFWCWGGSKNTTRALREVGC